jgi:hypothetical protein
MKLTVVKPKEGADGSENYGSYGTDITRAPMLVAGAGGEVQ